VGDNLAAGSQAVEAAAAGHSPEGVGRIAPEEVARTVLEGAVLEGAVREGAVRNPVEEGHRIVPEGEHHSPAGVGGPHIDLAAGPHNLAGRSPAGRRSLAPAASESARLYDRRKDRWHP